MRLDGDHYNHHHRSSDSLCRGGSLEENNSNIQQHRHQSNSNSDNSTTHETSIETSYQSKSNSSQNDHLNKSNQTLTSKVPNSAYSESSASDNQIKTVYNRDHLTQNLGHQSHHIPKKTNDENSNTQLSEMNSDEEEDDEEEVQYNQERGATPTNSNYRPPQASTNSNYENMPYNYSTSAGANEISNRYCLEQTIRNLHAFQDVRNLSTSASSLSTVSQSMNIPSHTQNT